MAYSQTHLLLFTICLFFPTPSIASTSLPSIPEACSNSKPCIQVLESIPQVRSAVDYWQLCIGMTNYAVANLTTVQAHIQDLLKGQKEPKMIKALSDCKSGYNSTIDTYNMAVFALKRRMPRDPTASYAFFTVSDGIQQCKQALASQKIEDQFIEKGEQMSALFQACGRHVVDDILKIY